MNFVVAAAFAIPLPLPSAGKEKRTPGRARENGAAERESIKRVNRSGGGPYEFHRRVSLLRLLKTLEGDVGSGRRGSVEVVERSRRDDHGEREKQEERP